MTASYPTSIKSFTTKEDYVSTISASHINDLQDEVVALETTLGTTGQILLTAGSGVPKTTGGCASAATTELTTNKLNFKTLDFDAATEEHADWTFAMPKDYNGGTITAKFFWVHAAATAYVVVWGIEGRSFGNDEALDQAVGTAVTVSDTGGTTSDIYVSDSTAAVTLAGTPAANELCIITIFRKAADGSDTLDVDAKLVAVQLSYSRL